MVYRSRLTGQPEEKASRFTSSVREDLKIFYEDIDGTEAHEIMLYEQGIISIEDLKKILTALEKLRLEKRSEKIVFERIYEDIHELIEDYVINETGLEVGGKLHTGRSRNDQVALDIRMSLRSDLNEISSLLLNLIETLLRRAEDYQTIPMLLYTHTQHAQIGTFSQYLLAYTDNLFRDFQRLQNCYGRVNQSPLGAGPIGGTDVAIDRNRTAFLLGFEKVLENSVDAISSRDFMLEAASVLAIIMAGLSRIAEDFVLWSSAEFGYLEIDDAYASVSSIMPQKKNPTVLELIRGKTGRTYGNLVSTLSIVKSLPTGYSSDLQETKTPLWDSIDVVKRSLEILDGVAATFKANTKYMADVVSNSYAFAVDLAEHLTEKTNLSFREAHILVGNLIKEMTLSGIKPKDLKHLTIEAIAEKILEKTIVVDDALITTVTNAKMVLSGRKPIGSPSPSEIERMLNDRKETHADYETGLINKVDRLNQAKRRLLELVDRYIRVG